MARLDPASPTAGDVRDVLRIALPLILAASGHAIRLFCDRVMLSQYSPTAIQASLPAGVAAFTMMTLFLGTATYATTFVAQYAGAHRPERAGPAVWQGLWIALFGGLVLAVVSRFADEITGLFGHAPHVQDLESAYFRILTGFAVLPLLTATTISFWSGRGKTWIVMGIELGAGLLNVVFNRLLIFGAGPVPELGIRGAALGTVLASAVAFLVATVLFLQRANRQTFRTWPKSTLDAPLFRRVLRYGAPHGLHFMLDVASFNIFTIVLGRYGPRTQEAANVAFSMNAIAFIPMIGIGMAVGILVGQAVGAQEIPLARKSVRSARLIVLAYMGALALTFTFKPDLYLALFRRAGDPDQAEVLARAAEFMRYIAVFLVFDGMFILYNSAIKGAGDTKFSMYMGVALAWVFFAVPAMVAHWLGASVWVLWAILVVHVMMLGLVFYWRYRGGKWQQMRVIEPYEEPVLEPRVGTEPLASP
jgi:MATE family multidrug resistance protein